MTEEAEKKLGFGPIAPSTPGSMPSAGADGAILVSNSGDWVVGVDKDAKAKSLQATEALEGGSVAAGALTASDAESGDTAQLAPDSLTFNEVEMTREQLSALLAMSGGSVDPTTNGGRLAVTPAYMNTTSDSALQANSTDDQILFGWTQEIAYELAALSIYVTAIGTQGNITLGLYTADSSGEPDTLVFDIGTVDSGASADTWIRKTFTAQQLYPGTRYCIVASVAADKDVSFSYNRQDTGQQSGLVPGCWSKSTTNGGTDWTDVTKDSQPALLNIVMASTENHVPQLVYGWTGKAGNKIALYGDVVLGGTSWELQTIPDEGLFEDLSMPYTDGVLRDIMLSMVNGTMAMAGLEVEVGGMPFVRTAFQDGIAVIETLLGGDPGIVPQSRFIGLEVPVNRVSTYQAPIRCDSYNTLWNADNQTKQILFRLPSGDSQMVGTFGQVLNVWTKLFESDAYTVKALFGPNSLVECEAHFIDDRCHGAAIGIDTLVPHPKCNTIMTYFSADAAANYDRFLAVCLEEGEHTFYLLYTSINAEGMQYRSSMINGGYPDQVWFSSLRLKYMG